MKISRTNGIEPTSARRVARRSGPGGEAFHIESPSNVRGAAAPAPASPLAAVDSLLTLQAVPEAFEGKRRAVRRAGDMLDMLDDIRVGLLEGTVPRGKLEGLLRMVQNRREAVADPGLSAILDEIELRAQVELAKFATLARR